MPATHANRSYPPLYLFCSQKGHELKIAISGKGGSGKTTISATLTRILARRGLPVLAIDGDPNPNLIQALGLGPGVETEAIPRSIVERREDQNGQQRHVLTRSVADIVSQYGLKAPDGVTVLVGTHIDHAGAG